MFRVICITHEPIIPITMRNAVFILFITLSASLSAQQSKYALVVGNADYAYLETLKNSANDANDIGALLRKMDFEVDLYTDLKKEDFQEAIKTFNQKIRNFDIVLFYYAGHGLELGGKNYFVPIDALATSISEIKRNCVGANSIIYSIKSADADANIIILDACRSNPFTLVSASDKNDGLALMDAPPGTIISFATAPGKVAYDGIGRNGEYTNSLLTHLGSFDAEIKDVFATVRSSVVRRTNERQVPWESTSLTQPIVLRPKPEVPIQVSILEGDSVTFEGNGELHAVSNLKGVAFNWYYEGKQFTNGAVTQVNRKGRYQVKAISQQGQVLLTNPIEVTIKSFVEPQTFIEEGQFVSFNQSGLLHGKSNVQGTFKWLKGTNVVAEGAELEVDIPGVYRFQVTTNDGQKVSSEAVIVRIKGSK